MIFQLLNRLLEEDHQQLFHNNLNNPQGNLKDFININNPPSVIFEQVVNYFKSIKNTTEEPSFYHSECIRMLNIIEDFVSTNIQSNNPIGDSDIKEEKDVFEDNYQFQPTLSNQRPNSVTEEDNLEVLSLREDYQPGKDGTEEIFDYNITQPKCTGGLYEAIVNKNPSIYKNEIPEYMSIYLESLKQFSSNIKIKSLHKHIQYLESDDVVSENNE